MAAVMFATVVSLTVPAAALAQSTPDAGSVLRQIEGDRRPALPPEPAPELAPAPPPLESIGGATVTATAFRFAGNTLLSSAELEQHVAAFVGKPLDFAGLQNAAIAAATAYRDAGWVVRAYLPRQDVTSGVITIQIVEATFGGVRFEGAPERAATDRLGRIVERAQPVGAAVNAAQLDRSLLLINDLPGVTATGRLAAGRGDTETDLVVAVEDGPLVSGNVALDNAGARYTGESRVIGTASLDNRLGLGDRAEALLLSSRGSNYARLAFDLPLGSRGWRLGASASHLDYEIVTDEFAALDAHGTSTSVGFDASYPLVRSRLTNLYLDLDVAKRRFDNRFGGATATDYSSQTTAVGLMGNRYDRLKGGGVTAYGVTLVGGTLDLDGSPNQAADALTTRTAGSFGKVMLTASRLQTLTDRVSLFGSVERQIADGNLDSSERLYLGGSQGVRAYPESEAGGSEGTLVNIEARTRLTPSVGLTGFVDWGKVRVHDDNDFPGAPALNSIELKGFGAAVAWRATMGLQLQATVARRSGRNPNAAPNGDDQDGSLVENRIWLQVSMPF